ncbi:MAG: 1-deoxy-D-xylulose-5-phosphate reductoisomerase [Deltaproteobacteria bacterium]|nr:1-deoxy-D-xylulose-5-phosphate reductoisomerase [Deltaproteobacteria bacterium]
MELVRGRRSKLRKNLVLLGATGSIGTSTLDIVGRFPDRFHMVAMSAGKNVRLALEQALRFRPRLLSVMRREDAEWLSARVPDSIRVLHGDAGLMEVALIEEADLLISALVGAVGLKPTFEAIRAGRHIALANKETLVMAGDLVMNEARKRQVSIFPVDSEHSAILHCMMGHQQNEIRRILLTASGGPFLRTSKSRMKDIRPEDALVHPTWKMGSKITVDSSTLMNKGLEAIEAKWLFGLPIDAIDVHIHPQSIVHSLVEFCDGSVVAHLGLPDMRIPIAFALSYPERLNLMLPALDLFEVGKLSFEKPDFDRFPCLGLALEAGRNGDSMAAVLNAANETAVALFLESRIRFTDIAGVIADTMAKHDPRPLHEISEVLEVDRWAREAAFLTARKKD